MDWSYGGDDRGPTLNAITWVFTSAALGVVGLRLWSRFRLKSNGGLDDVIITFAMLFNLAIAILISVAIHDGYGKHLDLFKDHTIARMKVFRWHVLHAALSLLMFSFPKLATVAMLIRILGPPRWVRALLYFGALSLVAGCGTVCFLWIFRCSPIKSQWDDSIKREHCIDPYNLASPSTFVTAYAGFLDFSYALYPAIRIFMLQMPLRKKIGYSVSLGLGFIAWIIVVLKATIVNTDELGSDPTWAYAPYIDWTVIEANVLIVAASTPAITPAIRAIHNQTQLSFSRLREYGTSGSTQKPSYLDPSSNVSKNSQKEVELRRISQMRGPHRGVTPPSKHVDFVTSVLSRDEDKEDYTQYGYKSRPGTRESFRFFRPSGTHENGEGKESLVGEYRREVDTSLHHIAPFNSTFPTYSATASKV